MNQHRAKPAIAAFNLIELLAIIAIIAILAATVVQIKNAPRPPTRQVQYRCQNNERLIAIGFFTAANDHDGRFPWQDKNGVPTEFALKSQAASQYSALSNYLKDPAIFLCPSDRLRERATNFLALTGSNISYFINLDANRSNASVIMGGDRHLEAGENPVSAGLFIYTNGMTMSWTRELHGSSPNAPMGTLSFGDGHVERLATNMTDLTEVFRQQNSASTRLLVP